MPKKKEKKDKKENGLNQYAKYSSLAIQMMAVILIFTFLGVFLDRKVSITQPVFTIVLSLFGVFLGLYIALKDFIKK